MRRNDKKDKGFLSLLDRKKDEKVTAKKEEDDGEKSKSLFGKMFGLLFGGVKTILGGMMSVVSTTVGALSNIVWGLMKTIKTVLGFLPSIFSAVTGVVGIITNLVEKVMGKFIERLILSSLISNVVKDAVMPKVFSAIMAVVGFLGKRVVSLLGGPLATILGVGAAVYAGHEALTAAEKANQGLFNDAFVKEDPKGKLDTSRAERDKKLSELENKYAGLNRNRMSIHGPNDPGDPEYLKQREKIEEEYGTTRSDLQKEQNKYFIEEIEPKLREEGYTMGDALDILTPRYVPPGSDGFSIPVIKKDGEKISDAEYLYLGAKLGLIKRFTKSLSGDIEDFKKNTISKIEENPIVKSITDEVKSLEQKKNDFVSQIEDMKNGTGEALTKLFKDYNLNKGNAEFLPPIVNKTSEVINSGKSAPGMTMDTTVSVRTDDPTLKKVLFNNLRPV
jgi:chromatin segregation and condensation protein Rec8/ScpA/Scc1 (kleisin family)